MIAAARADELKQACITAFETAIHDAGLLALRIAVVPWPGCLASGNVLTSSDSLRSH